MEIVGEKNVNTEVDPSMAGEDFAFMLQARPEFYIMIGNGDSAALHKPGLRLQ